MIVRRIFLERLKDAVEIVRISNNSLLNSIVKLIDLELEKEQPSDHQTTK